MEFFDKHFARIHEAASRVAARPTWDVLFVSHRAYLFDAEEFRDFRTDRVGSVHFVSDFDALTSLDRRFDIAIVCNSAWHEHVALVALRQKISAISFSSGHSTTIMPSGRPSP